MKLFLICFSLFFFSCNKETVEKLNFRNDIAYKINSNEPFSGMQIEKHHNGQIAVEAEYKDGKRIWGKKYFLNGQLEFSHIYKNGKFDGVFNTFYENGQIRRVESYKDGEEYGLFENYNKDGAIVQKTTRPNGQMFTYFEDGKTKQICPLVNNKMNGECVLLNHDGTVWRKMEVSNNEFVKMIFDSGKERTTGSMVK